MISTEERYEKKKARIQNEFYSKWLQSLEATEKVKKSTVDMIEDVLGDRSKFETVAKQGDYKGQPRLNPSLIMAHFQISYNRASAIRTTIEKREENV